MNINKVRLDFENYLKDNQELVKEQIKNQNEDWHNNIDKYLKTRQKMGLNNTLSGVVLLNELTIFHAEHFKRLLRVGDGARDMKYFPNKKTNGKVNNILVDFMNLENKKGKKYLSIESILFISLKSILNLEHVEKNHNSLAIEISTHLLVELKNKIIEEESPGLITFLQNGRRSSNQHYRNRIINNTMSYFKKKGIEFKNEYLDLKKDQQISLGALIIHLIIDNSPLFDFRLKYNNKRREKIIIFSEEFLETIKTLDMKFSTLNAKYRPMLMKPKPWTSVVGGGYLTNEDINDLELNNIENLKTRFIRTHNKKQLKENNKLGKLDFIYKQINRIQETAYTVNKDMLEVFNNLKDRNIEVRNKNGRIIVFQKDPYELPKKEDYNLDNEDSLRDYKNDSKNTHQLNANILSEKSVQFIKLNTANNFSKINEFYYPHNLDTRGRLYPIPVLFTTQTDDFGKSLLQFKSKQKLGDIGLRWFLIVTANNFGKDKLHLIEREEFVLNNLKEFREIGKYPLQTIEKWSIVDKPFAFLSNCIELNKMYEFEENGGELEDFETSLIGSIDATNSGTQHMAAIVRDEEGGKLVNLTNNEDIADIYREVSDKVLIKLNKINKESENYEFAKIWLDSGLVNRSLTKRPTMTKSYGVSGYGIIKQTKEYLISINADTELLKGQSINLISKLIDKSINETVTSSKEVMDYFQSYTRLMTKAGVSVKYTTPLGFVVYNNYVKFDKKVVKTFFGSMTVVNGFKSDTKRLDSMKSVNGISPNIIHSLDSSFLFMCVNSSFENGINDFLAIHDSFGVHFGELDKLNKIVREEFIKLYEENDIIKDFREQMIDLVYESELEQENKNKLLEKLEEIKIPESGILDLREIIKSEYFFN